MITSIGDRSEGGRWLAAGLCLMRLAPPSDVEVRRIGPWILSTMGERLELPPVGVIADIGGLLLGAALSAAAQRQNAHADPRLETAIRRYEDGLLGRLSADPRLFAAGDAIAKLPLDMHAQAVAILVAGVLARTGFRGGKAVQPGIARDATERSPGEVVERGYSTLRDDSQTRAQLAEGYEALVLGAQRARHLIADAEVFALENLRVLQSLTQRLAVAQIVEAQEALTLTLPRRIKSTRKSTGEKATTLEDESAYPIGGFSSMSTSGSLENLVTSELIYMDAPGEAARGVDLFDMRYVEGELLYYTRDEAIFVRQRRVISFLLGSELVATRVKDPGLPWQRIVLLLGLVLTTVKKLTELLGNEALRFRVVFLRDRGETLTAERELCELLLREWRDKGMAEVVDSTLPAELALLTAESRRALVEVVPFALNGQPFSAGTPRVVVVPFSTGLGTSADLESWSLATLDLLAALL